MPRPIFIPLSGRDRRFAARELRAARDHYAVKMREAEAARDVGAIQSDGRQGLLRSLERGDVFGRTGAAFTDH
jgi:hypothetical protein